MGILCREVRAQQECPVGVWVGLKSGPEEGQNCQKDKRMIDTVLEVGITSFSWCNFGALAERNGRMGELGLGTVGDWEIVCP